MEGLLSLLLFAAAFFFVLRFGFGVGINKRYEHGKFENQDNGNHNLKTSIDPVCGIEVDVKQDYGIMHDEILYRFCSQDCMSKFEAGPELYLTKQGNCDRFHGGVAQ